MAEKRKNKENLQFDFTGAWMPAIDPAIVGPTNFVKLENLRYNEGTLETVLGYSKITTNGTSNGDIIRDGIQLTTARDQYSYIFIVVNQISNNHQYIYQLDETPPITGEFNTTAIVSDTTTDLAETRLIGRLGDAANGHISFCNESQNFIFAGDKVKPAAVFRCEDATFDGTENPIDVTINLSNSNIFDYIEFATSAKSCLLVMATRKLSGVYFNLNVVNYQTSALDVKTWDGDSFDSFSTIDDQTVTGGVSLSKDGWVNFSGGINPQVYYYQGVLFYAYQFILSGSGATAQVAQVSLNAPFQESVDIWDGVYRQPIQAQYYNTTASPAKWEDFTLAVNTPSDINFPIGMQLDGLTAATAEVIFMFEQKILALKVNMLAGFVNTAASVMIIERWNGTAWTSVGGLSDGTDDGGNSLGQSGVVFWNTAYGLDQYPTNLFGQMGFAYKMTFSVNLSGTDGGDPEVLIDSLYALPEPLDIVPYSFSIVHKNRTFYFDYKEGHETNRQDYTMANAPDVFNGWDSSMNSLQSIYYGGYERLTGSASIYNRFGSNILSLMVVFKNTETFVLAGDIPEEFKVFPVSKSIGCPCPMTIETAEIGFSMTEEIERNITLWMSYSGPMIFDGAVIRRIRGIENFFDPAKEECINYDYMWKSVGWFDDTYKEYNFVFPSGTTATENSKWLIYDLVQQKWYERITASGNYPSCKLACRSEEGARYIYSAIEDDDLRLTNNGPTYEGNAIISYVEPGDFWPSRSIWHETRILFFKIIAKTINEDVDLFLYYFKNTGSVAGIDTSFRDWYDSLNDSNVRFTNWDDVEFYDGAFSKLSLQSSSNERLTRATIAMNELAYLHRFGFQLSSLETERAFLPIAWGIKYEVERDDLPR